MTAKVDLFRFSRLHLLPRAGETLLHRNVILSLVFSSALVFVSFRLSWFPSLEKVAVKDLVAGILAFSALGFGAATAASVLAISIPRGSLYYSLIFNGANAPRVKVTPDKKIVPVNPDEPPLPNDQYGSKFKSYYADLVFVFLWTMGAQLALGAAALVYFLLAGDLNMVDLKHCHRAAIGLLIIAFSTSYAVLQMGSLLRAMADYAGNQETYDRRELAPIEGPSGP